MPFAGNLGCKSGKRRSQYILAGSSEEWTSIWSLTFSALTDYGKRRPTRMESG